MAKKKLHTVKSGFFSRGISMASIGLKAGAKAASKSMETIFADDTVKAIKDKAHLISQMGMLAEELGKLKGSVMKVGQMLSVYGEHFLPPEANLLLKTLQSDSPPLEWPEIQKCLQRRLGKEKMALLDIEENALAAASLGQVHRARLKKTGQEIVLKIQYPGVDKAIDSDIRSLRTLLSFAKVLPKLPDTDRLFEEIKSMLRQEIDYGQELTMLELFREKLKDDDRYVFPSPLREFSTNKVLAMSYEPGVSVDSEEVQNLSEERRNQLSVAFLDLYFRELYEFRMVQTDPHFGNYRIRIDKKGKNDQLVLYDYGAVRKFSQEFMTTHKQMLQGILLKNREEFERAAIELKVLAASDPQELKDIFFELCSLILEAFMEEKPYAWGKSDLPERVTEKTLQMVRGFKLRSPPRELVFLDRKMIGVFTFLSALQPKINARKIILHYLSS